MISLTNHDSQWGRTVRSWSNLPRYPLVNVYITMERSTIFNGKIQEINGHLPRSLNQGCNQSAQKKRRWLKKSQDPPQFRRTPPRDRRPWSPSHHRACNDMGKDMAWKMDGTWMNMYGNVPFCQKTWNGWNMCGNVWNVKSGIQHLNWCEIRDPAWTDPW